MIKNRMKNHVRKPYRQIRYDGRKSQLLESAARLFLKKGYEKATMEDIADELLMTKGSLYSYIQSKEDLLFQCHMKAIRMGIRDLIESRNLDLSPKAKLREAIVRHVELITREFVVGTLQQKEVLLPKDMREKVIKERDKFEKIFLAMLKEAFKPSDFKKGNMKIIAYAILGAVHWIPRWYSATGRFSAAEVGAIIADYLIGNIQKNGSVR